MKRSDDLMRGQGSDDEELVLKMMSAFEGYTTYVTPVIADEAILKVTDDHTWGEAMASLVGEVRQGRPADGIVAAIERVGAVLAEHFPRTDGDINEIPDKLIEL